MEYKSKTKEFFIKEQEAEYKRDTVSIHDAKTNFSKLVKRAAAGEAIYIGSYGRPEVILMAVNQKKLNAEKRQKFIGCMKGQIKYSEGLNGHLPDDIIESFYSMEGLEEFEKK
ncbi:MAG: type II toxin-antitoxin system prevent-host-death family antitoxin [Treponema sp.]|jgi:prevent-host-death family protein|nr:type II toxin-antitoxin system prevent-host-death family antitoxin [Treponema sp.]